MTVKDEGADEYEAWEQSDEVVRQLKLATEIRQLGHMMLSRRLDPDEAEMMTRALSAMSDQLSKRPELTKTENVFRRNRIATFLETGEWPPAPPNGARLEFDPASFVGGDLNPFGMGARYYREGDEAVGFVNLGPCFEGPPGRVHGGVICAVFDEIIGSVFRATGSPSAFTGELAVRFDKPAPLNTELEFRARRVSSEGRRQIMEAEARSPEGVFANAEAIFVNMRADQLPAISD